MASGGVSWTSRTKYRTRRRIVSLGGDAPVRMRALTHLTEVSSFLRDVSARARALVASLSAEQTVRRPDPNAWSVAECLAHLTITANAYAPVWRDAFTAAKHKGAGGREPYRMDFMGRMLNWSLEPGRFRHKTPTHMQPINVVSGD